MAHDTDNIHNIRHTMPDLPYSGKVWWGESLANRLFSSIWRKKIWRINRSTNRLSIVCTNLLVWRITDDSPNSPNFSPSKLSHYTVNNSCTTLMVYSTSPKVQHSITIHNTYTENTIHTQTTQYNRQRSQYCIT